MKAREFQKSIGVTQWCAVTACGLGHMRPASGTWGSTPPVIFACILAWFGVTQFVWIAVMVSVALVATVICVACGNAAERALRKKDPSFVVIDEVAGQAVALIFVWSAELSQGGMVSFKHALWIGGGAFVLFRIFDIVKPPPIRGLQRFHGGWGIVVDDLAAGLLAGVAQLLLRSLGLWF